MAAPLLHRLPSVGRYDKVYRIHGFDHLVVEAEYSDEDFRRPRFMYWTIRDTRFTAGLDRWRRWQVLVIDRLADVRSWIKAGGPGLWDPERRMTDKGWRPIPNGWTPGEEGSEVPRRADPRIGRVQRMGVGPDGGGSVRQGRRESGDRDPEAGRLSDLPLGPGDLKGKKYAVCPGTVRSVSDGQLHHIGFGALTWLYGVRPDECVLLDERAQRGREPKAYEHLIYLYPQRRYEDYLSMREELARGDDAFKLVDP